MFRRSWVQIPAPVTGWTLFRYICCNYCGDVCLEIPKINNNRGPFKKVTQEEGTTLLEPLWLKAL